MKKSIKKIISLGLASTMAFSLVACSSDSNGISNSDNGDSTVASNGKKPVTLSITWWGGQPRHEYTQQLLDLYTELNPHVTFQAAPSGWDGYFDKLSTQAASGAMPDIVQMDYLYLSTYAKNNSIADLKPYIDSNIMDVSGIPETILNTGIMDDKLSALPISSISMAVGYNPEVFDEAGIEYPTSDWTWSDFIEMNQKIKTTTGKLGSALGPVDDTNILRYWIAQHGYQLFSEDYQTLGYDDDQIFADFIQMWADLMEQGMVSNPDEYAVIQSLGRESGPVVTGDAGMTFEWGKYAAEVSGVNPNIKVVTPPLADDSDEKGLWVKPGQFLAISETCKNKEEAAAFINWFVNSEEANDIIKGERGVPVSENISEYMINSGNLTPQEISVFEFMDQAVVLSGETPAPDPVGMSEINTVLKNTAYKVFYGQISAIDAAKEFRTETEKILQRSN